MGIGPKLNVFLEGYSLGLHDIEPAHDDRIQSFTAGYEAGCESVLSQYFADGNGAYDEGYVDGLSAGFKEAKLLIAKAIGSVVKHEV